MTRDAAAPLTLAVVRRRYSRFGGAERFIERSLAELPKIGIQPTLLCAEWDDAASAGATWEIVRLGGPEGIGRVRRELNFERQVHAYLSNRHFDLIQSHERIAGLPIFRAGDGLHREWLRQRAKAQSPAARWLTQVSPYHRFCLTRERQMYNHPDLRIVICNSDMVRSEIAEHYPQALSKVRLVRNGIDCRQFTPATELQRLQARQRLGLVAEYPLAVFVGSGFERKGVGTILRCAALAPQARFLIVGHDKQLRHYQRQASALEVSERVTFVGAVADVSSYLDAADAFMFPTLYDPGPNAVLEAMAKGLPILTSDKCGLAELVAPAGAGFVHAALDAKSFAKSLLALQDEPRRRAAGMAARSVALRLGLDSLASNLHDIYRELQP